MESVGIRKDKKMGAENEGSANIWSLYTGTYTSKED